jgi:hypothetical protein
MTWAVGTNPGSKIVLSDGAHGYGKTLIGVQYSDSNETHFLMECFDSELEGVMQSITMGRMVPVINHKAGKSRKSINPDVRKVVITRLNPSTSILRLYWRIPTALSDTTDVFWTDVGRDGNIGAEEEMLQLFENYKVQRKDIIDMR